MSNFSMLYPNDLMSKCSRVEVFNDRHAARQLDRQTYTHREADMQEYSIVAMMNPNYIYGLQSYDIGR